MRKQIFNSFILFTCFWVILSACKLTNTPENIKLGKWSPSLTAPLVNSYLNLKNLVENQKSDVDIQEDANGFYTFIYYTDFDSLQASSLADFMLPDQSFSPIKYNSVIPAKPVGSPPFVATSTGKLNFQTPSSTQRLDQIDFKGGQLSLNWGSTYKHDATVTITIPNLTKNGQSLVLTKLLTSSSPSSTSTVSLDGYSLDLTKNGTNNSFNYTLNTSFAYTSSIQYTGEIGISASVSSMEFSVMKGYFGNVSYSFPETGSDTIDIKIFDNTITGYNIQMANPQFEFDITNSFGVPIGVDLKNKIKVYSKYAPTATFKSPVLNNPIVINSPTIPYVEESTIVSFDKSNSPGADGIPSVFNNTPYKVLVSGSATLNQNQIPANTHNFVTDKSKLKVRAKAIIPMEGKIPFLVFEDTVFLSMKDINVETSYVEYIKLRTNIANGFPLDGTFQMYFLNENGTGVLDSLVGPDDEPIEIKSGLVSNGKVVQSTQNFTETLITRAKFDRIKNSLKAKLRVKLNTVNNGTEYVKIYSSYFIDVKISGEGKLVYNLN